MGKTDAWSRIAERAEENLSVVQRGFEELRSRIRQAEALGEDTEEMRVELLAQARRVRKLAARRDRALTEFELAMMDELES